MSEGLVTSGHSETSTIVITCRCHGTTTTIQSGSAIRCMRARSTSSKCLITRSNSWTLARSQTCRHTAASLRTLSTFGASLRIWRIQVVRPHLFRPFSPFLKFRQITKIQPRWIVFICCHHEKHSECYEHHCIMIIWMLYDTCGLFGEHKINCGRTTDSSLTRNDRATGWLYLKSPKLFC